MQYFPSLDHRASLVNVYLNCKIICAKSFSRAPNSIPFLKTFRKILKNHSIDNTECVISYMVRLGDSMQNSSLPLWQKYFPFLFFKRAVHWFSSENVFLLSGNKAIEGHRCCFTLWIYSRPSFFHILLSPVFVFF